MTINQRKEEEEEGWVPRISSGSEKLTSLLAWQYALFAPGKQDRPTRSGRQFAKCSRPNAIDLGMGAPTIGASFFEFRAQSVRGAQLLTMFRMSAGDARTGIFVNYRQAPAM